MKFGKSILFFALLSQPLTTFASEPDSVEPSAQDICQALVADAIGCQHGRSQKAAFEALARCEEYMATASDVCLHAERELFACMQDNVSCDASHENCGMLSGRASLACPGFASFVWQTE